MNFDFTNKVVLVTGAAGGIGYAAAKMFAECGAKVMLSDINEELLQKSTQELKDKGYDITCFKCDVSSEESVKALIEKTVETYGRIDCAYNNVGIHAPVLKADELEIKDFDRVIAVNLRGCFLCMKYELQVMKKQKSGAIVNCSSQSGVVGTAGLTAYTASKHGIIGMTKCAALEYAREGIKINALCPGTSDTPMVADAIARAPEHMAKIIDDIPLGRMGKAEEIASAVLYMCSEYNNFIIGHTLVCDGGFTIV